MLALIEKPRPGIQLIALDMDQTLFGDDLVIAEPVSAAIQRALKAGIRVTIATGREAKLASRFALELGLDAPIIAAQGGCIYDHLKDVVLHNVRLEAGLLPLMIEAARRNGWNYHFESFDRLYFPLQSRHTPAFFELLRYSNWVRVGDLLRDMPEPPQKMIVMVEDSGERESVRQRMIEELGGRFSVISSHPHLLEALPRDVHKGHGLAWLAEHLGIGRAHVMAIGDSEADVPMLTWAGVGVAMGNGSETARSAAAWIAPPLREHGVAVAIEKFALSESG